jgi:hypothetical protein
MEDIARARLAPAYHRPVLIAAATLVAHLVTTPLATAAPNACLRSAAGALRACVAEAQSAKRLTEARCANLVDAPAVKACAKEAAGEAKDARDECREQTQARRDVCERLGAAPYAPAIDPTKFTTTIDNPYFPLVPGTTFVYEAMTDEGLERVEFEVTHDTRVILGVTCVEVHDRAFRAGKLHEDTRDWFAQDVDGNVWYFGESTAELDEDGLPVDVGGSWSAGVDGAQPGIIMKASPMVGDFYRQEFLLGEAEDLAEVVSLSASAMVPFGSFTNLLETEETSPLSPDDLEHKFYKAGVGQVLTIDVNTGEREELIDIVVAP